VIIITTNPEEIIGITDTGIIAIIDNSLFTYKWDMFFVTKEKPLSGLFFWVSLEAITHISSYATTFAVTTIETFSTTP
jgi:hypothetical protein